MANERHVALTDKVYQHILDAGDDQAKVDYWSEKYLNFMNAVYGWHTRYRVVNGTAHRID